MHVGLTAERVIAHLALITLGIGDKTQIAEHVVLIRGGRVGRSGIGGASAERARVFVHSQQPAVGVARLAPPMVVGINCAGHPVAGATQDPARVRVGHLNHAT